MFELYSIVHDAVSSNLLPIALVLMLFGLVCAYLDDCRASGRRGWFK